MEEACRICKEWHEHVYWDHQPRRVKFCKTLDGDFFRRLSIPKKFMSQFRGKLSKIIHLKGPSGNIWNVGLAKVGGGAFLQCGWKEFVEAHHLEEKDTLFFEYEGNSCLSVSMFDSSECERESSHVAKNCSVKQEMASEVPQGTLETDVPSSHKDGCSIRFSLDKPQKPLPSTKFKRAELSCLGRNEKKQVKPETMETNVLGSHPGKGPLLSRRALADAERDRALQLALAFKPTGPSFLSPISKYNTRRRDYLAIPVEFAKKYLPKRNEEIILRLPYGKETWHVNYRILKRVFQFATKWRSFFKDNALEEGDVCVFEQSAHLKRVAMTVHIFRVKGGGAPGLDISDCSLYIGSGRL